MDQEKVGKLIAKMRKEKGITQQELGDKVGVGGKAVSKWETGKGLPDTGLLFDLSEELGISVVDLLKGEITKDNDNSTESREHKVLMDIDELKEFTQNGMELAKKQEKKKFKKKLLIALILIFLLLFSILGMYFYNNYNKVQIYRVESTYGDVQFDGILAINGNKSTLSINNFVYTGKILEQIKNTEYSIMINNKKIYSVGDIEKNETNHLINTVEYFKTVNIYINNIQSIDKNNTYMKFKFISEEGKICEYKIPLKFTKEYSNDKIIYIK